MPDDRKQSEKNPHNSFLRIVFKMETNKSCSGTSLATRLTPATSKSVLIKL